MAKLIAERGILVDNPKLALLVAEYQATYGPFLDKYLDHFKTLEWPSGVLHESVYGKNGAVHGHQWRLQSYPEQLGHASAALTRDADKLKQSKVFPRLLDCVESILNGVDQFGPLAYYDIALRIGAYLDRWPPVVYLHAGTKIGYENLTGSTTKAEYVDMEDLPKPLHVLKPYHVENFLCIFKDRFRNGSGPIKPC